MTRSADEDPVSVYDRNAANLAVEYEAVDPTAYRASFHDVVPTRTDRLALDVGAGSGRDAAWLCGLGFDVVAVEPAAGMRAEGQRRHADAPIRWLDDRLPSLTRTHALGLSFDLILLSAVWQHVPPNERGRAFRKLVTLLRPAGVLVLTLRRGPSPPDRPMHPVTQGEVEALAREHGLQVVSARQVGDTLGRSGVDWTTMCLRLPDDGAGALPLLRGIILNDGKSSTYKLGLLRAISKVADLTPSLARPLEAEDAVELPLGAVALNWVRMYLPLVSAGLPQAPRNAGPDGLGFAKEGFRRLLRQGEAAQDLRVGAEHRGERAAALSGAIADAARTIAVMPANFTCYPNSEERVFVARRSGGRAGTHLVMEPDQLWQFGALRVPGHVWRAMQRLGAWIDPVLVAEWARLTRAYAGRDGRDLPLGVVEAALAWQEPVRDVRLVRDAALSRLAGGERLTCVWSGRPLSAASLDIDHCIPWSAWPCGDLWNLLPTHRITNQREKKDLLPSAATLSRSREAIVAWWQTSWSGEEALGGRFKREAQAALAIPRNASFEQVFEGLEWRRLRLRQDQQIAEWVGTHSVPAV